MLNDYTRNAIYRRTGCLDKFGYSCALNKNQSCPTPYKSINYTDVGDQTNPNLPCNTTENAFSDDRTPPPIFMDKFYNIMDPVASQYDINIDNLDIKNMTKTDYYYAVTTEQSRTTTASSLEFGLKGPIEFILASKADPEQTVHYWSADNWRTTNEFIDKQQEGEHVYVTLRIHQANYSSGQVVIQAYSKQKGKKNSGITKHTFTVTGYNSVASKPENGISIPYYFEYLTNWFDIDPTTNRLYAPMSGENGQTSWNNIPLTDSDKEILSNYISWLNAYAYTGPTSEHRDKIALEFNVKGVQLSKAITYTYGTSSLISTLVGATLNDFISSAPKGWLQGNFIWTEEAEFTGLPEWRYENVYKPSRVDFRMNGDDIEMKTFGSFKFIRLIGLTNMKVVDVLNVRTELFAYPGFTMTFNDAGGAVTNGMGSVGVTSTDPAGVISEGWTKIASLKNTFQVVFYHHMTRVHTVEGTITDATGTATAIKYDIETPRDSDIITKTYVPTSTFKGVWIDGPAIDQQIIQQAGVLGFNYQNSYILSNGTTVYGTKIPTGANVVNVTEQTIWGMFKEWKWGLVGYMMPHTKLRLDTISYTGGSGNYTTNGYGLRGISLSRTLFLRGVPVPGTGTPPYYYDARTHYLGYDHNETTNINETPPQGLYDMFQNIPGLKVSSDLVGYQLIRRMQVEATGVYFDIQYTIRGSFHDNQTDETKIYISFATIKPTVSGTDANFNTHIFKIENQSAGIWIDEFTMWKYGYKTYDTYFFVPVSFPTSASSSTLKSFNYHPDGNSVILNRDNPANDSDFYTSRSGNSEAAVVITPEYLKAPNDHTLLGDGKRKISTDAFFF
jgi:hypothetical protein